jgi:formate--tetrahydrofolate ligase
VATVRALRYHGGSDLKDINTPDLSRVEKGFENLAKHIENIRKFNLEPVVAINAFLNDTKEETEFIINTCAQMGIKAVISEGWAKGGNGTTELAKAVAEVVELANTDFKPIYSFNMPITEKIERIAKEIYGADGVIYEKKALTQLKQYSALGFDDFAVCMAKTQKSLSDDESLRGRPRGFNITVREIEIAAGAQFIIPLLGKMMRMPGLPETPASENMFIDDDGKITGLS